MPPIEFGMMMLPCAYNTPSTYEEVGEVDGLGMAKDALAMSKRVRKRQANLPEEQVIARKHLETASPSVCVPLGIDLATRACDRLKLEQVAPPRLGERLFKPSLGLSPQARPLAAGRRCPAAAPFRRLWAWPRARRRASRALAAPRSAARRARRKRRAGRRA
eukprot:2326762-Pleurochrysis_carterae.AAC.3